MKAARVHRWGSPPSVDDVAEPGTAPGRALVRIEAATVGHIDRTIWLGGFRVHPPLPYVPGVEGAGVVESGSVFAPGTRVWIRGGGLGTAEDGTWAELASVPEAAMGILPGEVPFAAGASFFSPCTSAWTAVHEIAQVRTGETLLVTGAAGAVGSAAVRLALAAGARVLAAVSDPARAASLPDAAEVVAVSRDAPSFAPEVADALVDTVGGGVLAAALDAVRPGGRAVLVGYLAGTRLELDLPEVLQRDVALLPLNMIRREAAGRLLVPKLLEMIGQGELEVATTEMPLAEAAVAFDRLAGGVDGRLVLRTSP